MKILYFTIVESIIFLSIGFYIGTLIQAKTSDTEILYGNYAFWILLVILSILLNFKKYLYFASLYSIIILVTIGLAFKLDIKSYFRDKIFYLALLLIITSMVVLFNFIVSKYFIYDMINTEPQQGDKGDIGKYGNSGQSLFIDTIAEKCFQDVYNHLEESYEKIKKSNDVDFDAKNYHINNYFIKDNIKRICYSKEFLDNFYLQGYNSEGVTPECVMQYDTRNNMIGRYCNIPNKYGNIEKCNIDSDCYVIEDNDIKYKRIVNNIKNQIAGTENSMLELILRNNCKDDIKLRNKLGGPKHLTLDDMYNNPNETIDRNFRYNNRIGHKFLNDEFMNDKYWEKHLNKKINNNPFDRIKNLEVWQWGIPKKKCVK